MKRKTLDWSQFDWTEFEQLCIKLAEQIIPDISFSQHLAKGHKQDGIDLLAFSRNNGSFLCIQCKKVESLSVKELNLILQKFKDGIYFNKSSSFVIATSYLINSAKLQNTINELRLQWYTEYNIEVDCWDRRRLETFLRDRWDLVSSYFGLEQANDFCYPFLKTDLLNDINEPVNFINRRITLYDKTEDEKQGKWYFFGRSTYELAALLKEEKERARRICLIGEAHNGKSFLLQKAAYELKYSGTGVVPLFIVIRNYSIQPLAGLLQNLFKDWQKIPLKKIVLFIDGVDEVPADRFDEIITHISEFSLAYQPVSIVFSCRKLFFHDYTVETKIKDFDVFDLCPLDIIDINSYLKKRLGSLFNDFERRAQETGINDLLTHPFYLNQLVEKFLPAPHELPASKISIVEELITNSWEEAKKRKLKGSDTVKRAMVLYKKAIQKFAFALQLAGANTFKEEEIQELFQTNEMLLLSNSPLVTSTGSAWGFTNAFFQEHIAAVTLSTMLIDEIVAIATVGKKNRKIKLKWIQTLSSLLAILDEKTKLFQEIYSLFEEDNLELLFQTESSKFDDHAKRKLLEKLLQRCIRLNNRPFVVHEETIGYFIQTSKICKDYLLECLRDSALNERIRIVCCRILQTANMTEEQSNHYMAFVLTELDRDATGPYAGELLDTVISHKMGGIDLVNELVGMESLNTSSEYRGRVYEIIRYLNFVDVFYDYGLSGIESLRKEQTRNMISGSERNLEEFLLGANDIPNLRKLMKVIQSQSLEDFFDHRVSYRKDFFTALFEKLAGLYETYPMLIFPVAEYVKHLGRKYLRDEFKQVDTFLDKTNTHWLVLRILIQDVFENGNWQIGALITEKNYDYLLFEHEHNDYEPSRLRQCMSGLQYRDKSEKAEQFRRLCIDATEGEVFNRQEESKYLAYQAAEKQKKENDLIYIQNVETFKQAVSNYFKAYGKSSIPVEDLYVDIEGEFGNIRKNSDSNFIWEFLVHWQGERKVVHLQQCLKMLNDEAFFEAFRAEEILDYHYRTTESDIVLIPILQSYYKKLLPKADFVNSYWLEDGYWRFKTMEVRLGQIFLKFEFDTPIETLLNFLWLDNSGTRGFKTAGLNKQKTISQLIFEKLDVEGRNLLRKKVVANLKHGIQSESILGTHLELCRELKIKEATDVILNVIKNSNEDHYIKSDGVDIYLELGGDLEELLFMYKQQHKYSYFFLQLLGKLCPRYYDKIFEKALDAINDPATEEPYRTPMLQILADAGCIEAFRIIVDEFEKNKIVSRTYSRNYKITKLSTELVLSEVEKIVFVLVDPNYNYKRSDESLRSILLDWLYDLAKRGESDLGKVLNFFDDCKVILAEAYSDISDLHWYENRAVEEFRKKPDGGIATNDIMKLLKEAGY